MKDKIKKDFIQSNKDRDALSEEMIKELKAKGGDNMNGEVMADEKLMAGANGTVNISKYKKWKKLYESGGNMRKQGIILHPAESKAFLKLYKKGN